ncbi:MULTISPECIES: hypothetical protein [unclassified Kitasatospora]|uniref:hypothetical protein n=1 Tax=unclassified Kitasatospora TaxID=2633591 RepID=UPI003815B960
MTIQPGQIYRAVCPNRADPLERHIRIKVTAEPNRFNLSRWTAGKVQVVTLTDEGREVRPRSIKVNKLHASATTRDGQPRRTGYVIETQPARCRCHSRDGLTVSRHENDCPLATQPGGSS